MLNEGLSEDSSLSFGRRSPFLNRRRIASFCHGASCFDQVSISVNIFPGIIHTLDIHPSRRRRARLGRLDGDIQMRLTQAGGAGG